MYDLMEFHFGSRLAYKTVEKVLLILQDSNNTVSKNYNIELNDRRQREGTIYFSGKTTFRWPQ